MRTLGYVTPGDVLREEFLEPLAISGRQLARDIGVAPNRISQLLKGERSVTAETALLLAKRFETSPEFWLNLQNSHDLEKARDKLSASGLSFPEWGPHSSVL
ncbi:MULTISPECIES: HigA family addiction module antitoxin [unclassified Saccharibacter]|uniref:HigA family addiction module antitoxin n=1 Tax=unclassified Saccharibacter TaxID=2648722 RepID=UPI001322B52C|nr:MULTISPECIES: HigA family addiction module antitoxin [unclassified Saccharibacter]MXV35678.1 HigA family addiction module antidote protein [Saccharibacter sp. EH611]MXV58292.1 HigA family addiction module antidote protein [Saccharibacter sp. EH70]MXV66411.1 HigA family addiction module antidote protein [Saccharibacter sp. EH60]